MSKVISPSDLGNIKDDSQFKRMCSVIISELVEKFNGNIDISPENLNISLLEARFTADNTATTFNHSLGRIPSGYIICYLTASRVIYNGDPAKWTSTTIELRASGTVTAKLILF